jgi:hypothetical protein
MTDDFDAQQEAAHAAAVARQVIATRIAELARDVTDEASATVVAHLAEAYGNLASEPPRVRS